MALIEKVMANVAERNKFLNTVGIEWELSEAQINQINAIASLTSDEEWTIIDSTKTSK
tara:strand:- start:417 stop:590 length:174 start_codon:yes stop_codon:yes gene_type:complete